MKRLLQNPALALAFMGLAPWVVPSTGSAQATASLTCDVDQDGFPETITVNRNKVAVVTLSSTNQEVQATFDKRYPAARWSLSCENTKGTIQLEIVLKSGKKKKAFSFSSKRGGNNGNNGGGSLSGCSSVQGWPNTLVYKTIGSHHFSSGDGRRNTFGLIAKWGFRGTDSCVEVLAADGKKIAQLGDYGPGWNGGPDRWYSASGCGTPMHGSALAQKARKAAGSSNIYMKIGNTCYGPIDAGRCKNSGGC